MHFVAYNFYKHLKHFSLVHIINMNVIIFLNYKLFIIYLNYIKINFHTLYIFFPFDFIYAVQTIIIGVLIF